MNVIDELLEDVAVGDESPCDVVSPFTGAVLARLPQTSRYGVEDCFVRARSAQAEWAATPIADRRSAVARLLDRLDTDRRVLLDILQTEAGKARIDALADVGEAVLSGRRQVRHAERVLRPSRRAGALPGLTAARSDSRPWGVVVVIAPWNAPIGVGAGDSIPALLAGNAVILKPDNQTALSTLYLLRAARAAGIPRDVFQVVLGDPSQVGDALLDNADYVAFTGSTATGRRIAAHLGSRLVGCSLELGGKNPMIVRRDADLRRAAKALPRAAFANAGQVCLTTERLLVHSAVEEEFLDLCRRAVTGMRIGSSLDFESDMGSLTTAAGFRRTQDYVEQAVSAGARIHCGGRARPDLGPQFFEPTILTEVTDDAELHSAEVFGPVVSVYSFDDDDEAVEIANATEYGLSASVWTRDVARGRRLAARIDSGAVNINDAYTAAFASHSVPSRGMKSSGTGRRHGDTGLLSFTQSQAVAVQRVMSPDSRMGLPRSWHGRVMSTAIDVIGRLPR